MTPGRAATSYRADPYPGEVPSGSFVLEAGRVRALERDSHGYVLDSGQALTRWLATRRPLVPLLSYGSNSCPGRLVEKFGPHVDGVVALSGELVGAARVWSRQPSSRGSVPMTLAHAPQVSEPAHLLLLPERHLTEMDRSEGRGGPFYSLVRWSAVRCGSAAT